MLQRSCVLPLLKPKVRLCKFEIEKRPKDLISQQPAKAICRACSRYAICMVGFKANQLA